MDLDKAIKERHSVRSFKKNKSADWRDIIKALDAATKAPLAGNLMAIKFIIVTEEDKIKEIADACQQDFVGEVDYLVVVCSDDKQLEASYYERAEKYGRQQAGAAIENFLLKITDLGLATCWVGAFADEIIKKTLRIPDNISIEGVFPIGYEFRKSKEKPRPSLDHTLYFNEWSNKRMIRLKRPEPL